MYRHYTVPKLKVLRSVTFISYDTVSRPKVLGSDIFTVLCDIFTVLCDIFTVLCPKV